MDSFSEYMVKAKKKTSDYINIVLIIIGAALLSLILFLLTIMFIHFPALPQVLFLSAFLVWYFAIFRFVRRYNVEYEYSLTESDLDVDKIMSRSMRKKLIDVNVRSFEIMAPLKSSYYTDNYKNSKTVFAASSEDSEKAYFAAFTNDGVKTVLIFEPNEKMLRIIERYCRDRLHKS